MVQVTGVPESCAGELNQNLCHASVLGLRKSRVCDPLSDTPLAPWLTCSWGLRWGFDLIPDEEHERGGPPYLPLH